MKITKEWLEEKNACPNGKNWFLSQSETIGKNVVEKLISENKLNWANWLIVRVMSREQYLQYAKYSIFAAEQVVDIFEKQYPSDVRPRQAIEAAKKVFQNDTLKNLIAAAYAAAYAAADAADTAAAAAADAADARKKMKIKILNYGLSLLEEK